MALGAVALLVILFFGHLCLGSVTLLSPLDVISELFGGRPQGQADPIGYLVWEIRLPRALAALLVGGALAVAGATFQSLFRNPIADPFIIGISSAAAVGGAIASLLPPAISAGPLGVAMAFASAMIGLWFVLSLGKSKHGLSLANVLISGVAVGSFLWGLISFILVRAGQDSNKVLYWLLGSLAWLDWTRVIILLIAFAIGFGYLMFRARELTLFSVGESTAATLGIDVHRLKLEVLIASSLLTAASVATVGIIGFIGLFCPHICRKLFGSQVSATLPACVLVGGASLLAADLLAQRLGELNVGIVTALIGAPILLIILRKR